MFLVILLFILLFFWFFLALALRLTKTSLSSSSYENKYRTSISVCGLATAFCICVVIFVNFLYFSEQKSDYLEIERIQKVRNIYIEKADELTEKFKKVLVEDYPTYEKDIFNSMSPEDLQILFVKYPEIKASFTTINYIEKIDILVGDIYRQDILLQSYIKDCKFMLLNPWLISGFIPKPPENLKLLFN